MTQARNIAPWLHAHEFAAADGGNERRIGVVAVVTAVTMVVEIVAGFVFGSMALLADGWHMGTHVAALGISLFAYGYARRHTRDPRFTFGTGKVGVLGGFTSAVVLGIVALLMAGESTVRFFTKSVILFDQAIIVAIAGLIINLVSALILRGGGHHHHGHDADGEAHEHVHDHNFTAAYLHVVADALTSVLAIIALVTAKIMGYVWLDPLMGLVGSALIARWAWGLLKDTGHILLDVAVEQDMLKSIRSAIETASVDRVSDLHVWKVGPSDYSAIVSVVSDNPRGPDHYKCLLAGIRDLSHVNVEVHDCRTSPRG